MPQNGLEELVLSYRVPERSFRNHSEAKFVLIEICKINSTNV